MQVDLFDEIQHLRQSGRKAALATIVQIRGSVPSFQTAKLLVRDDRIMSFDLTEDSMAESGLICGGKLEIFIEPILPTPKMVIFGAGHISTQLSKIATIAGFKTTIVDNRPAYANSERFPEAEAVYSDSFEQAFETIVPNENTYLVIVTRGHQEDETVLRWAVHTNARYIGMIGSKRKVRTIFQNLENEGVPREKLERVCAPIGLDVGAVLPEEIAVAIVAEAIHCRRAGFKHPWSKKIYQTVHS
jgi:xanthine dehydrogenase accessory factor